MTCLIHDFRIELLERQSSKHIQSPILAGLHEGKMSDLALSNRLTTVPGQDR
jgi:hypothetical protein